MNSKGFLGSIGDDLPSLIPLFFALMIFFAALAYAFTTINERNDFINTYIDSLSIAKASLGDASFVDLQDFKASSNKVVTSANYIYGLVYIPKESPNETNLDFSTILEDVDLGFICYDDANNLRLSKNFALKEGKIINGASDVICNNDGSSSFYLASASVKEELQADSDLTTLLAHKKSYSYIYPATLLTGAGNIVVYLVVIVW